jgi:hypothetical protein
MNPGLRFFHLFVLFCSCNRSKLQTTIESHPLIPPVAILKERRPGRVGRFSRVWRKLTSGFSFKPVKIHLNEPTREKRPTRPGLRSLSPQPRLLDIFDISRWMKVSQAMGSLFDINVAMEKEGFAPASKGGRAKATATLDGNSITTSEPLSLFKSSKPESLSSIASAGLHVSRSMEKEGFAPASKGGRAKATATLDVMLEQCKEDEGLHIWKLYHYL